MILSVVLFIVSISIFGPEPVYSNAKPKNFIMNDTIVYLNIPPRSEEALTGSEIVDQITGFNVEDREKAIVKEILAGNVPSFSRKLRQIKISKSLNNDNYILSLFAACDYAAVGSDEDYLYTPMTPSTAQYLADRLECTLPTKKIVDILYSAALIKLDPQPISPSDRMTTVLVFWDHTDSIKKQISQKGIGRITDNIVAGHKKDIIISNKIYSYDRNFERVVIYGWHLSVGNPIQPVYNGHIAEYADYSHGVRMIYNSAYLNGDSVKVTDILQDQDLYSILSSEGIISKPYYPGSDIFTSLGKSPIESNTGFYLAQCYPNPFNPSTVIRYAVPIIVDPAGNVEVQKQVSLKIYNVQGSEIATLVNQVHQPGEYNVVWNASSYPSGVYFYKMNMDNYSKVKKMIMIK